MKTLLAFSILLLGVALCVEDVWAQAPMKNGMASHRERRYILTAEGAYKQRLSVAEARFIAQTEDAIAEKSKDKKKPYLLPVYLAWRTNYYKQLRAKREGLAKAQAAPPVARKDKHPAFECGACGGTGLETCWLCGGSGKGSGSSGDNCVKCRGTGLMKCQVCGGSGKQ